MAYDDLLKRYQEAGVEFLDAARTRAEELFRELQRIGESTQDRVEGSKRNTDAVVDMVRRELTSQLTQLSAVTRSELTRIFETLETVAKTAAANAPGSKSSAPEQPADAQAKEEAAVVAPIVEQPPAKVAPAVKGTAKKAPGAKKAPPTKKAVSPASETPAAAQPAKKTPAKKAPAAKEAAKKAPATKKAATAKKAVPAADD